MNSQPINSTQKSSIKESIAFHGPLKKGQTPTASVQKELMLTTQLNALDKDSTPRDIIKFVGQLNQNKNREVAKELVQKDGFTMKLLAGLLIQNENDYTPLECIQLNLKLLNFAAAHNQDTFCDDFCNGIRSLFIRESASRISLDNDLVAKYSKGLSEFIKNNEQIQRTLREQASMRGLLRFSKNGAQLNKLWNNLIGESGNQ